VSLCPAGLSFCSGTCRDLNTSAYCGACDQSCLEGEYCRDRACHARGGSCPYLFLWSDGAFRFHTDLSGSPLAKGMSFFHPRYYGANIYDLGTWSDDDGWYRMRLRELVFESSYFDEAVLVVADVPAGHGVVSEWSSTPQLQREPSRRYVTTRDPRLPLSAVDAQGQDVRTFASAVDGVPVPVRPDGLTRVVVDFGLPARPHHARLLLTTWGVYNNYRGLQTPPYSAGTTIETPDGQCGWRERLVAGKSASDARTFSVDIGGIISGADTRLRITCPTSPRPWTCWTPSCWMTRNRCPSP
jgi:hypothetical protein